MIARFTPILDTGIIGVEAVASQRQCENCLPISIGCFVVPGIG